MDTTILPLIDIWDDNIIKTGDKIIIYDYDRIDSDPTVALVHQIAQDYELDFITMLHKYFSQIVNGITYTYLRKQKCRGEWFIIVIDNNQERHIGLTTEYIHNSFYTIIK